MPWLELLGLLGRAFLGALGQMDYLLVLGLVLMIVHGQYERQAVLQERLFGVRLISPRRQTAVATLYGLGGGVLATAIFILLGFSLTDTGIWYVWPLALVLMLVRQRFLCFAYAGGLVGLSNLLFGWPRVHVPALLALIAALHLVESILIRINGASGASPIYTRTKDGRPVGGFLLIRFWPVPVIALMAVAWQGTMDTADLLKMPEWWPLLPGPAALALRDQLVYTLMPVVVALGYGDIAVGQKPLEKARISSRRLMLFSLSLLTVAVASNKVPALAFVGVFWSPVGHELVILLGQREELKSEPLYAAKQHPVVLTVLPDSPADAMGLEPGDEILAVNGSPVYRSADVMGAISPWSLEVEMYVRRSDLGSQPVVLRYNGQVPPLGIIFAPEGYESGYVPIWRPESSVFSRLWNWLRRKAS